MFKEMQARGSNGGGKGQKKGRGQKAYWGGAESLVLSEIQLQETPQVKIGGSRGRGNLTEGGGMALGTG